MRKGWTGAALVVPLLMAAGALAGVEGEPVRLELPASPEIAARAASLRIGHAEILRFGVPVGTIIVGDSQVLDATAVNDRTVVLTALAAGATNVVVLDQDAEVLARLNLRVGVPEQPRAEVYRGRERSVLVCDPDCVPVREAEGSRATPAEEAPAAGAGPAGEGVSAEAAAEPESVEPAEIAGGDEDVD